MSKTLFWTLSWTWGIIVTLIGSLIFAVLTSFGYKPFRNIYGYAIEIGEGWGGLEMGPFCLVSKNPSQHTLNHEFGHGVQNCFFGPFMLFISLASAVRYWYREYQMRVLKKSYKDLPDYDSIWFEGDATRLGNYFKEHYDI
jgi:hypothetical protein